MNKLRTITEFARNLADKSRCKIFFTFLCFIMFALVLLKISILIFGD